MDISRRPIAIEIDPRSPALQAAPEPDALLPGQAVLLVACAPNAGVRDRASDAAG